MAPFLALLDDQRVAAGGVRDTNGFLHESYNQEFDNVEKAHLIFTSRDSDTYSWLSPYMDKIMESDLFKNKIKLHVYLTGTKYNTLPSFVFWRAFILRQQQESNGLFTSPAHIQRPNFSKIFAKINSEDPGDFHVYVCAADCIVEEVEKACEEVYQRSG